MIQLLHSPWVKLQYIIYNHGPSDAEDVLLIGDLFQIVLNLLFPAMKQK